MKAQGLGMWRHIGRRMRVVTVAAILALVLGSTWGIASALGAIPDANGVIHGCYQQSTGALRVVDDPASCKSSETAIQWSQTGPQGPQGAKGDKGDTGTQGSKGDTGSQGAKGDTGSQGPKGDTGAQGPKGDTGPQGPAGSSAATPPSSPEYSLAFYKNDPDTLPPVGQSKALSPKADVDADGYKLDFAAENPTTIGSSTGGAGAGRAKLTPLTLVLQWNPVVQAKLLQMLGTGGHYQLATLTISQGSSMLRYRFKMIFITGLHSTVGNPSDPSSFDTNKLLTVTVVYGAVTLDTVVQNANGQSTSSSSSWSQVTNSPTDEVTP